jgi:High potential iron-sulfur protein
MNRREFLVTGASLAALLPLGSALAGCGDSSEQASGVHEAPPPASPPRVPEAAAKPPVPPATAGPAEAPAAAPAADAGADDRLVTEIPANATMVQTLHYVNQSPKTDQRCEICQLFTARRGGRGKCQLFPQGLVSAQGWCQSWVQRAPA